MDEQQKLCNCDLKHERELRKHSKENVWFFFLVIVLKTYPVTADTVEIASFLFGVFKQRFGQGLQNLAFQLCVRVWNE